MPIKPVTYYEAWCDGLEPHQIELGDFTAFGDDGQTENTVRDSDGVVCADGRVFCEGCKPDAVCPDTDDNVHVFDADGDCAHCSYSRVVPAQA